MADQGAAFRAAAQYPAYDAARFANYPNAWPVRNITGNSLYVNPGYAATAAMLGLAAQPTPYDYGGNVVVQPNAVYVDGSAAGTPQDYSQSASQLASAGAADPDPSSQWMPLGVFAAVQGDATSSDDIFQLAVNNAGVIRGNYHNNRNDQVTPIAGSVDKQTQKAAWTIGGDQMPVYEAGIANLTKNEAPMLVHSADGGATQMELIRLPQPDGQQ
jgi:hypothetical protein